MRKLNKQQVFNKVSKHLLTQLEQCIDNATGVCQYRGDENKKCAIGYLIPDSMYDTDIEGLDISSVFEYGCPELKSLFSEEILESTFLQQLQKIHDIHKPKNWFKKLESFAKKHNLTLPAIFSQKEK